MDTGDTIGFIKADWPAPSHVFAGCTTRRGGGSQPPFDGLNLASHVGDDWGHVELNRRLLGEQLRLPQAPNWLEQVHGNTVVTLGAQGLKDNRADASVSALPGQVCTVMTADCLPVLFCDRRGQYVAAAHAGWRGLATGVLVETVAKMPCQATDIFAWLGPAIGAANYEVDDGVRDVFVDKAPGFADAFSATRPGHWLADLYALARYQLAGLGITSVHGGKHCTYDESDLFYSYRRESKTGRMASLIWFEKPGG